MGSPGEGNLRIVGKQFTFEVRHERGAPAAARAAIREVLAGLRGDELDATLLVVSEAVANAVERQSSPAPDETIRVALDVDKNAVSGEIRNGRLGFDVPIERYRENVASRLYFIDHLSSAWSLEFGDHAVLRFRISS